MNRIDDLGAWRAFVAFARAGSFSAAAKTLDVEVSSVSRAVRGLERGLGCGLIRHNTRPLELTDDGRTALKRMEAILRAHASLIEGIRSEKRSLSGTVRLSTAPGFATRRLMPVIREFCGEHPDVVIDIQSGLKEEDVARGACDLAVLTREPVMPGLVYTSRGRNLYLPVASPGYVNRHGLPLSPADLRRHRGYIYSGPMRSETRELFRGGRSEPLVYGTAVRSIDVLAIREAVIAGMGIAVDLPLVQICEDLVEGRLVPILPGWGLPPVECFIVANRNAWHLRRVRVFFDWFARRMRGLYFGFEDAVSSIVGIPPDRLGIDRTKVFMTDQKRRRE